MNKQCGWGKFFFTVLLFLTVVLTVPIQGEAKNRGKVLGLSGRLVELNFTKADGVTVGTQLQLVRYKEVKRGDTVVRTDKLKISDVEIVKFEGESALAKMLRSYRPLEEGDIAIVTSASTTAAQPVTPPPIPVVEKKPEPKPAPVVETKPEPVPQPAPVVEKAAPVPEPVPVVEAEPEPAQAEAEEEVQEQTQGSLNIVTKPSKAKLTLNGKVLGTSPKTVLELDPGRYTVVATKKSHYLNKATVKVKAGQSSDLTLQLKRFEGKLQVNSMPKGAALVVDGQSKGKTNTRVYLKPGKHTLLLHKAGYKQMKKIVKVSAEKAVTLTLVLTKQNAPNVEGMVYIPGGEFIMGSQDGNPDERPARTITVDGFYIDKYEVTNAQFSKFVEATGHIKPAFSHDEDLNKPNSPVVGVSWEDAAAYAKWAGKRLPTEAEWEKAARGFDGRAYPWGNNYEEGRANKVGDADSAKFTAPVKSFANGASPYGVINLAGNAWEWTADWYQEDYYSRGAKFNPPGPHKGERKAIRGGSWEDNEKSLRTSNRYAEETNFLSYNIGFRCAK